MRICGQRGDPVVARALVRYAAWLRKRHSFPIRVPVYLLPGDVLLTRGGQTASASFFAPYDRDVEPYIRIATGDYPKLCRESGRDNALAAYIVSLSHELIHYWQWIETGTIWERGVVLRARGMLQKYADAVRKP
jgi:hypothetical protein